MTNLLRSLAAAFRRPPAARDFPAPKRRRSRGKAATTEAGAERLVAVIEARFDALDAAMAVRAQAQLLTLAQLIGEAIVAECRGLRRPMEAGKEGEVGAGKDDQPGTLSGRPNPTPP